MRPKAVRTNTIPTSFSRNVVGISPDAFCK